ncbi:uncharacterized protein LOC130607071 isoform X2 [Pezoporus wallicus]|uniref:uncharacterized protein LOC130607071 isoform X2 n=1 Tax=Pezoporus wallicus TaxID=35540 RepID=UPI00254EB10E|nr:uncharacterized protein LOC130607071 isoform X2 [Pezoporus wallicus]
MVLIKGRLYLLSSFGLHGFTNAGFGTPSQILMLLGSFRNDRWVWIGMDKRSPDSLGTWQWSDDRPAILEDVWLYEGRSPLVTGR